MGVAVGRALTTVNPCLAVTGSPWATGWFEDVLSVAPPKAIEWVVLGFSGQLNG